MATYAENQRARFDYRLEEEFEAGLELRGYEVKAIRAGKMALTGARVVVRGGEAYLLGATIEPYQAGNLPLDAEPGRNLRLLLAKKEIDRLTGVEKQAGLTIVPLKVYNKSGRLKLALAIARGQKKYDKREVIKKRDTDRQIRRTLKRF
jgi:SsrA-binding protein